METTRTPQTFADLRTVKARCPSCQKLYAVETALIQVSKPQFACVACQTQFWFSWPTQDGNEFAATYPVLSETQPRPIEVAAPLMQAPAPASAAPDGRVFYSSELPFPVLNSALDSGLDFHEDPVPPPRPTAELRASATTAVEAPTRTPHLSRTAPSTGADPAPRTQSESISCPKCGADNRLGAEECLACGVVFKKVLLRNQEGGDPPHLRASPEVLALWERVLANYEDESLHEYFIRTCWEQSSLPFASHKYARILNTSPQEEIASGMRRRILALAGSTLATRSETARKARPAIRLPGFNMMAILLGTVVMVFGWLVPGMGNMTGVGGALLALALGLRFYLARES